MVRCWERDAIPEERGDGVPAGRGDGVPAVPAGNDLKIFRTEDGSDTIYNKELNQHYHSTFGAITESLHVFIQAGFLPCLDFFSGKPGIKSPLNILEIGFGSGLNALLTKIEADRQKAIVNYTAIELYPLEDRIWQAMNYPGMLGTTDHSATYNRLHLAEWNRVEAIASNFNLHKINESIVHYHPQNDQFHLIYFDAFAPDTQPELWCEPIFLKLYQSLVPGGILVTYSVKGTIVRAIKSAGFKTEKLPGPPGKRHILRAIK
jgi:tRNA U34 5-methylaminomethyl-2-thiouridine-forming methyltransferase MnmC